MESTKVGNSEDAARMSVADNHFTAVEDDDPPMLSLQALSALKEFLAEQNGETADDDDEASTESKDSAEVALVSEDWRLSQFWYDRETAETVAKEVIALCHSFETPSVACIACPTLYAYLKVCTIVVAQSTAQVFVISFARWMA